MRIISRSTNDKFDEDFFRRRLQYAYDYRKTVMSHEDMTACRLIFGEGDSFPGLTVDRFNNLLSVQILSLGIEKRRDIILPALLDILRKDGCKIDGIYLRNDVNIRTLEGMAEEKGWYLRENDVSPVTVITENGIKYNVDVENGQKTGFSLTRNITDVPQPPLPRARTWLTAALTQAPLRLTAPRAVRLMSPLLMFPLRR